MNRDRPKPEKTMHRNRFYRPGLQRGLEPPLVRMLLLSGGLHLAVAVVFLVGWHGPRIQPKPVYYVNLVNPPVRAPQAGRPDASPTQEKPTPKQAEPPKPAPKPVAPKPKPKPKPKPVAVKPPPPKPVPKVEPKPAPKPEPRPQSKPEPRQLVSPQEEKAAREAIEKLQRQREREKLKEELAAMAARDTRAAPVAQVGIPEGQGTDVGLDPGTFIKGAIQENWSFSLYQLASPAEAARVEALVMLKYDRAGKLLDYRILRDSGNEAFDQSLRKAVLKTTQLPKPLGDEVTVEARFNLKEMLEGQ